MPGMVRKPANFVCSISDDRGAEPTYAGVPHGTRGIAQYPLIKEYTLNNKGIHIMI